MLFTVLRTGRRHFALSASLCLVRLQVAPLYQNNPSGMTFGWPWVPCTPFHLISSSTLLHKGGHCVFMGRGREHASHVRGTQQRWEYWDFLLVGRWCLSSCADVTSCIRAPSQWSMLYIGNIFTKHVAIRPSLKIFLFPVTRPTMSI